MDFVIFMEVHDLSMNKFDVGCIILKACNFFVVNYYIFGCACDHYKFNVITNFWNVQKKKQHFYELTKK